MTARSLTTILMATTLLVGLGLPADAMTLFVANEKDNTVTVLDGETLEIVKTITTSRRPRGIIISHDFKEVYVCAATTTGSTSSTPKRWRSPGSWRAARIRNSSTSTRRASGSTSPTKTTRW